jgi:hypothetical protein
MNNPIIIELSKNSIYLAICASLVFIIIGLWIFRKSANQTKYPPASLKGLAVSIIIFFVICSGYGLYKLRDTRPGLVIDHYEIRDNSSSTAVAFIPWKNIMRFDMIDIEMTRCILVFVNNPEEMIRNANGIQKKIMGVNYKVYGTPVIISCVNLQCDIGELINILQRQYKNIYPCRSTK